MATLGLSKLISDIQAKYTSAQGAIRSSLFLKSNGGTIVDKSINEATVSLFGNTTTSTAQTKYQSHSILFDGDGDYLTVPASTSLFDFSGDYTVEAWVYKGNNGVNNYDGLFSYGSGPSADDGIYFECSSTRGVTVVAGGVGVVVSDNVNPNTNAWRHIAITRQGNTTRIFQNGSETANSTTVYTVPTSATIAQVGRVETIYTFNGYMEDVRVVCGTALYTSNFTPPTKSFVVDEPSEALTNLYNLTSKVSSGYKVNELPPADSKQFGSILRVDDTYYATNGSDWNTISLADSDYVNYIFQGTTAGHFVGPPTLYDIVPFATDVYTTGTMPAAVADVGRKSNAGLSDIQGNAGYIVLAPTTPLAKVDYASNTTTLATPFTLTTPSSPNSGSNITDVNSRDGYLARTNTVPTTTITMDKIPFANVAPGGATVNVGSLTVASPFGWASAGCPSSTHGFTYGGFAPGGPIVFDEIHKFPFASVTTLASTFLLTAGRGRQAGTASETAGYSFYGRDVGPAGAAQGDSYRFPFATDVSVAIPATGAARLGAASATSAVAAYIHGGNGQEFPSTTRANSAVKIPYASEAAYTALNIASPMPASPTTKYWQGVQG